VEDYGGVVEVQSEHLTDQVTDILGQSLTVWITLCLDASACCNQSPWRRDIRFPRLETLLSLRVPRKTPRKRLRVQVDDKIGLTLERREQDS